MAEVAVEGIDRVHPVSMADGSGRAMARCAAGARPYGPAIPLLRVVGSVGLTGDEPEGEARQQNDDRQIDQPPLLREHPDHRQDRPGPEQAHAPLQVAAGPVARSVRQHHSGAPKDRSSGTGSPARARRLEESTHTLTACLTHARFHVDLSRPFESVVETELAELVEK